MNIQKAIIIITSILAMFFFSDTQVLAQESATIKLTIYVSEGCQHCAKVEKFVELNDLTERIEYRDTANSEDYANQLSELFDNYGTPQEERGVPTMEFDGQIYN